MNVWVVTPHSLPGAIGGAARVSRDTPEGRCARGHNVAVRAPYPEGKSAMANTRGVRICRGLRRPVLPQTLTDMYEIWRARRRALADGIDVILAHGGAAAGAMLAVARRAPAVCVLTRGATALGQTALMRVLCSLVGTSFAATADLRVREDAASVPLRKTPCRSASDARNSTRIASAIQSKALFELGDRLDRSRH
jgi:hypothetical protein